MFANCLTVPTHCTSSQLHAVPTQSRHRIHHQILIYIGGHCRTHRGGWRHRALWDCRCYRTRWVAGVTEQQATMARVARTRSLAGCRESPPAQHATAWIQAFEDTPSLRPSLWMRCAKFKSWAITFHWSTWALIAAKPTCDACRNCREPQFRRGCLERWSCPTCLHGWSHHTRHSWSFI